MGLLQASKCALIPPLLMGDFILLRAGRTLKFAGFVHQGRFLDTPPSLFLLFSVLRTQEK